MDEALNSGSDSYQGSKEKLKDAAAQASRQTAQYARRIGDQVGTKVDQARTALTEAQYRVTDHARHAASVTDDYVRTNPWKALGVAAAAGLLIGLLLSRR